MDIDYDLLVAKIQEKLAEKPVKKLTGRAYWASRRRERDKLEKNYIAPESGAPMVSREAFEELEREGRNYSYTERMRLHQILIEGQLGEII